MKKKKKYFLPIGIPPSRAIVSTIPPWIIGVRVRGIVILSPEVDLFASKKRIGIFQFAKVHYSSSQNFSCDGDSPPSSEEVRVHISIDEDDKSFFRALNLRFLHPIKGTLEDDDEGGSVFLIKRLNDLSSPDDDFTFLGLGILRNLLEADRSVCLDSQFF